MSEHERMTQLVGLIKVERARINTATREGGWKAVESKLDGGRWQRYALRVIWSMSWEWDKRVWLHVSASREDSLPSYLDMKLVKSVFVGDERYAYTVWAPVDRHVNLHSNALHLWAVVDGGEEPLPDFTRGLETI